MTLRDYPRLEVEARQLIALFPRSANAQQWLQLAILRQGRGGQAELPGAAAAPKTPGPNMLTSLPVGLRLGLGLGFEG